MTILKQGDCSKNYTTLKEKQLLKDFVEGNEESFKKLTILYEKRIKSFVSIYEIYLDDDMDDLVQDVFVQIYISAQNFKGDSLVKTWIYSIAKYTIKNKLRRKKLVYFWQFGKKGNKYEANLIENSTPGDLLLKAEENDLFSESFSKLDLKSKEVLMLYEWSGFTYEQIAEVLNINTGTVKSRISNAKLKLKNEIMKVNVL